MCTYQCTNIRIVVSGGVESIMERSKKTIDMMHIVKQFPGVFAVNDVDFHLESGSIHAICGENGAGKSTLMKILAGVYGKDSGDIIIDGIPVSITNPKEARQHGISIIEQEFSLFSELNVYQNLFIGKELLKHKLLIDWKMIRNKTDKILEEIDLSIDKKTPVRKLSTSQQQLLEIAKSIFFGAAFLIMDEPTSSLGEEEKNKLFSIIRKQKENGVGIVYISHRMDEIFDIADVVTVMRDGKKIGTFLKNQITQEKLIQLMVGRPLSNIFNRKKQNIPSGRKVLEVSNLTKKGSFQGISFSVSKGEVLGFSGLMGAQRTELMQSIYGLASFDEGTIFYKGKQVKFRSASAAIKKGIGMVPEDRKKDGIVKTMSIRDNIILASHHKIGKWGWLRLAEEIAVCEAQRESLSIKMVSHEQAITKLSGGNQQKVILGRLLAIQPELLILDEPTRGIDVGAKAEVHKIIDEIAKKGVAIILISSELPEILGACDRIITLHEGKKTGEFSHLEATQELLISSAMA